MKADFGKTASDYQKHRAGFPKSFFNRLQKDGLINGSETVVDLGAGTGTVARGLAQLGCQVTAVDPSSEMLDAAAEMANEDSVEIHCHLGTAEATGLKDQIADVVTAGQCWHWFDSKRALKEVRRILRPGGLLLIAHFDWLPIRGNVVWYTEKAILESNPDWGMGGQVGIYPEWFRHMLDGGFSDICSYSYQENVYYTHQAWRGRIRASAGVGGSLSAEAVLEFDEAHRQMLKERFPEDPLSIPHQVFVIYGRK